MREIFIPNELVGASALIHTPGEPSFPHGIFRVEKYWGEIEPVYGLDFTGA